MRLTADIALVVCVVAVATDGGLARKLKNARRGARHLNAGRTPVKISSNIGFGGEDPQAFEASHFDLPQNLGHAGQRQGLHKRLGLGLGLGGIPRGFGMGGLGQGFGPGYGVRQPQGAGYFGAGQNPLVIQPGGAGVGSSFFQGFGQTPVWQQPSGLGLGFGQGYQQPLGMGQYQPYPSYGKQPQPAGIFGSWDPFGIFKGVGGILSGALGGQGAGGFGDSGMGGFGSLGLGGSGGFGNFPDYKQLLYQALGRRASSFRDINITGSSMSEQNYEQHYMITFTTSSGGYPRTCTARFSGTKSGSGVVVNPRSVNISC